MSVTRHVAPEVQERLDEIDVAALRTLALRHLGTGEHECVDPDRRIYVNDDGELYRSPYIAGVPAARAPGQRVCRRPETPPQALHIFGEVADWLGRFKAVFQDVFGGNFANALTRAEMLFREAFSHIRAYVADTAVPAIVGAITQLVDRVGEVFNTLQTKLPPLLARAFEAVHVWVIQSGIPIMVGAMENLASMAAQGLNVLVTQVYPMFAEAI